MGSRAGGLGECRFRAENEFKRLGFGGIRVRIKGFWVKSLGCRGNIRSRRLKLGCGDLFFCHQMRRMGIRLKYGYSVGDAGGFGHICSAGVHGLQTLNPKPLNPIQKGFPACHERPRGSRDHRDLVSFCKDLKGCGVHMKVNTRKI